MKLMQLFEKFYQNSEKIQDTYEVLELLNSDYSEAWAAFKDGKKLYRGLTIFDHDANPFISKITDKERFSLHSTHSKVDSIYNTLFSSKLDSWSDYPKRNKSVICSNSIIVAGDYGSVYYVLPINGTILGECPNFDLWFSFNKSLPKVSILLRKICVEYDGEEGVKDYEFLISAMNSIHKFDNAMIYMTEKFSITRDELLSKEVDGKKLIDHLNELLSPEKNGFKKVTIGEINSSSRRHEYWFSATCLYVDNISMKELLKSGK